MPQLYRLDAPASTIAATFTADAGPDPWTGDYLAPPKFAPVIISTRTGRVIVPRQWGVPPPPKVALEGGRPVHTVRNLDSPFWTGTLRHTEFRCLVPATGFMEWGGGPNGTRTQHWFAVPSEPVFALAGIWRDSEVPSFALLTCDPNAQLADAGVTSMPVILYPWDHDRWLTADWADARRLVAPYGGALLTEGGGRL